ncbi:MAG: hypothetical protein UX80_C0002G0048 [Candidatus Amesbacteria bacterium GW2011_GWA2_47_11b]|uniref:Uncharacterized protein n=3 Tax=Candidatus Amesiibacteriota TaxID=1752730 RepID=A0A0G1SLM5_9BACT|nr:MAG: hypothetical protein UT95_C0003G0024 [Candidatus Curtissbacteria bacterium GW2011_GWB1_40_28]KKU29411.1 MAG: hypothetical protein UX42_C0001G0163 [Microgenomates group bacterium GW2011_GWC1_46_20]KKU58513.1 MAG: hypothetical protein UX80_C0002G0048 [Candidatus Amesbacteria bacterium GW2011_GWA2_47_11b]KKU70352.1 MAG: hypothetical protein UX92_C0001G0020 [Candidatus Amesbacteria bacterium GW2011_GWA1_47_20]KKU83640.1 MAG: hypothetical protein UY11_C0015G0003 [Candidatus Amesbacteria bact
MRTIIPLAGKDARFEKLGIYKPLIMLGDKPLIYRVVASNKFPLEKLYFVVLFEHEHKYNVSRKLKKFFGNSTTVAVIDKVCEGAPNSILEAKEIVSTNEGILIDLGDIIRELPNMAIDISSHRYSGIIPIDRNHVSNVWGYVVMSEGAVVQLKEKSLEKIKGGATMGLYYFSSGNEFIRYTTEMISQNKRVEYTHMFYVGPVYNQYLAAKKDIGVSHSKIIHTLGSPEEISSYIDHLEKTPK